MRCYAGIGSRNVPGDVDRLCELTAAVRRRNGWILRSGHARGCDQAFERGAMTRCQIFLPWLGYNEDDDTGITEPLPSTRNLRRFSVGQVYGQPADSARELVLAHHPAPQHLTAEATWLHARNCHILLGPALDDPVAGVICWTDDETRGGTAFGLLLARHYEIPVHNLADPATRARYESAISGS